VTAPAPLPEPARPSWTPAVVIGAVVTFALHAPALLDHVLWLPMCCGLGCTGAPVGMVPAAIALRREPGMGASSGFAVAFIGAGLGAIGLAAVTLLRGFELQPGTIAALRDGWVASGYTSEQAGQMLLVLEEGAPVIVVVTAALVALGAGVMGAVLAGWTDRRLRRRAAPPPPR